MQKRLARCRKKKKNPSKSVLYARNPEMYINAWVVIGKNPKTGTERPMLARSAPISLIRHIPLWHTCKSCAFLQTKPVIRRKQSLYPEFIGQ